MRSKGGTQGCRDLLQIQYSILTCWTPDQHLMIKSFIEQVHYFSVSTSARR